MNIKQHIQAGFAGIYIVSNEEIRVESELNTIAQETEFSLFAWSLTQGIIDTKTGEAFDGIGDTESPVDMLDCVSALPEQSILLLRDFHVFLDDPNPIIMRKLKDVLARCRTVGKSLVVCGCRFVLPPELEKEFVFTEFELPTREQLKEVLSAVCVSAEKILKKAPTDEAEIDALIDAASGLTTLEAENAFSLSVVQERSLCSKVVSTVKQSTVKKNGTLEFVDAKISLDDIGGLDVLKHDLAQMRGIFTKEARDYGLPSPQGMLFVGNPGTGKSLTAKATAATFNVPLVRLEASRLFGSLVGESEGNWRKAFATAKAIAPCVLWIDEVDGLFSGSESSGKTDGGTTNRICKTILQDMQDNSDGVFFVMTANDIDALPDPLIDRSDVWNVDLPTEVERAQIWEIVCKKYNRGGFDYEEFAKASEGFSGRQIEQTWVKAMTRAFSDKARATTQKDVLICAEAIVPTSVTMRESIDKRRARLKNRSQNATSSAAMSSTEKKARKITLK